MKFDRRRFCVWIVLIACIGLALCQADAKGVSAPKRSVIAVSLSKFDGKGDASVKCVVDAGVEVGVSAVAFTRDGKKLAAGGYKELVVWDLSGAKLSKRVGAGKIGGKVHTVIFLKDGKSVVVGEGVPGVTGAVRIFDIETGDQKAHLKDCKDVVYSLAVSSDGKFLAAGSADNRAYVWTLADKKIAKVIKEHSGRVMGVAFSVDSKFLATGGSDNTTRIWKADGWESVHRLNHVDGVRGVAFRGDGKYVASAVGGSNGRIVRLHRMDNGKKHLAIYPTPGMAMDFVWRKSPNQIYAACSDNTVKLFDASSTKVLRTIKGHEDWVYSIAMSPDEKRIASGSGDGTVKLWNISDGKLLWTMNHLGAGTDDWVISTPAGNVISSDAKKLKWEKVKVGASSEELAKRFVNREKVLEAVWGKKVAAKPAAKPREKTESIVAKGSVWKYLDDGSDQGKDWYGRDYKDDSWKSGPAELGYGDKVEATVVGYGPDGTKKFMTTYFRRWFEVKNRGRYSKLYLDLVRDDGAIVYLNGTEILRSNMGKGNVTYKTVSSAVVGGADESKFFEFTIDAGKLVDGKNLLAVEIHQASVTSSDLSFDLKLSGVAKKKEDK